MTHDTAYRREFYNHACNITCNIAVCKLFFFNLNYCWEHRVHEEKRLNDSDFRVHLTSFSRSTPADIEWRVS